MDKILRFSVLSLLLAVLLLADDAQATPEKAAQADLGAWLCYHDGSLDACHETSLRSVAMVSSTYGWAVGAGGKLFHWDGRAWFEVTSPTDANLLSVTMLSASDGWAVGSNGVILHWDGSACTRVPSPTTNELSFVAALSATDGWAVGADGTILYYTSVTRTYLPLLVK